MKYIKQIIMKQFITAILILSAFGLSAQSINEKLAEIQGTFIGEWAVFRYLPSGNHMEVMSWTDTIYSSDPTINDTAAFVKMHNSMYFKNHNIPTYKHQFIEGFIIENKDIKDHFFLRNGVITIEKEATDNVFIINEPASTQDQHLLGFPSASDANHLLVKKRINVDGHETHMITRITTFVLETDSGQVAKQYVSLKGYHKKISNNGNKPK